MESSNSARHESSTIIHGVHEHGARRPRPRAVDGRASTLADLLR